MKTVEDLNVDTLIEGIKKTLANELGKKIENKDELKQKVSKKILQSLKNSKKVDEVVVENTMLLWESWTLWEKSQWIWLNYFRFGDSTKAAYLIVVSLLEEEILKGELEDIVVEEYIEANKKFWYENNPKSVIVVDVYFKPIVPIESVELKLSGCLRRRV